MSKIKNVLNGWKFYLSKDEEIEKMAKERYEFCKYCRESKESIYKVFLKDELIDAKGKVCNGCDGVIKCPLSTKLRSKEETCPLNNW